MNQDPKRPGNHVVGVDETGTGAWAGPFFVCAAAVPEGWLPPPRLNDSKKMTPESRDAVFELLIRDPALVFNLQTVEPGWLDTHGQGPTLRFAMRRAAELLLERVTCVDLIFDGNHVAHQDGRAVPKADGLFPAVMAASVLGKVARDRRMLRYDWEYPQWAFGAHKGYGTPEHQQCIARHGLSPIHRRSISRFEA